MTTDELNAIVQAVMTELEKAGVDFDFKAETPQADDLVYVMRGTADKYQGITVKWQNLLDIIVKKATDAKDEAVSAKDIALQTLATIQGIESNVSSMKSSVEASEANVTQMKTAVFEMKTSVEGTKTETENIKEETAGLLGTKADKTYVDGELAKKVNYTDSLTYEQIMAATDFTNKVASASVLKTLSDNLSGFSILKSNYKMDIVWDIDDLDSYPKGTLMLHFASFSGNATGTKPFSDGHLLTFIWRNMGTGVDILNQIAVEDNEIKMNIRSYNSGSWSDWKTVTIS